MVSESFRGQTIFNNRPFSVANVGNFNDTIGVNPLLGASCSTCHNQVGGANGLLGAAHVLGTVGDRLTCTGGSSTGYLGKTVTANDPGRALITGKCSETL